jgi:hypothetical protein
MVLAWSCLAGAAGATTINVEIDYMQDATHSHKPQPDEIAAVVQMFACHGVTLNVVVDEALPEDSLLVDGPDVGDFFNSTGPHTFGTIYTDHFQHFWYGNWHYCVFGHQYSQDGGSTGSSGVAEQPGYRLLVSLGTFTSRVGTPFDRAATFAHELGHNLGLTHGGSADPNVVGSFSPVYASIMSYQYQLRGVRTHMMCLGLAGPYNLFKDLDYSNGRLPDVNEGALPESVGVGMSRVDWNCNGVIDDVVAHDLNDLDNDGKWCDAAGTPNQVLADYNDWATVSIFASNPALMKLPPVIATCAPVQEAIRTDGASDCAAVQPTLASEACVGGQMMWCNPAYTGTEAGTGNQPFRSVTAAYASAPSGSILYLRPGTYATSTVVMTKPMILTSLGRATLVP